MHRTARHSGFSLVELSIVLVILGLLVGGILGGQSLIRAAELRAVASEYSQWQAATNAFREKYRALPGDMTNATRFWGKADGASGTGSGSTCTYTRTTGSTCDGNGNGQITLSDTHAESYLFWEHLSLAGILPGSYTGSPDCDAMHFGLPSSRRCAEMHVNIPASRVSGGGWWPHHQTECLPASTWCFSTLKTGNYLFYGTLERYPENTDIPELGLLAPAEAWGLDAKVDDGKPASGMLFSMKGDSCTTSTDPAVAEYALQHEPVSCKLMIRLP